MAAVVTSVDWVPANGFGNSLGERVLPLAAMGGAVSGAVGGAAWLADAGFLTVVCGTVGTMLGSGLATGAGLLVARLWARPAAVNRAEAAADVDAR
jgi:hypothetical protein